MNVNIVILFKISIIIAIRISVVFKKIAILIMLFKLQNFSGLPLLISKRTFLIDATPAAKHSFVKVRGKNAPMFQAL